MFAAAFNIDFSGLGSETVNFICALASKQRMTEAEVEQGRAEIHNLRVEKDALNSTVSQTSTRLFTLEQESASSRVKLESLSKQFREEKQRLVNERDELRSLNVRLSGRDEQYKAAGRKRENDYARLQKQLQTLSNQRTKDSKYKAFAAAGSLGGKKAKGDKTAFYTKEISSLEMRNLELLEENNDLRQSLRSMHAEVQDLVDKFDTINR